MGIGTAILWLAALTIALVLHIRRDSRRYDELKRMAESGKLQKFV